MSQDTKHYHGWIMQIEGAQIWFEPIPGEYIYDMTCRRQALKASEGEPARVVVMVCRGDDRCPTTVKAAGAAT